MYAWVHFGAINYDIDNLEYADKSDMVGTFQCQLPRDPRNFSQTNRPVIRNDTDFCLTLNCPRFFVFVLPEVFNLLCCGRRTGWEA